MAYTKRDNTELLRAALVGYQHQHAILGERIAEITQELGGMRPGEADGAEPKGVRSAETRSRMAAAQRKRWAKKRGTAGTLEKAPGKQKRQMSAEGRKNIAEATRKRWEAYRAQKASESQ